MRKRIVGNISGSTHGEFRIANASFITPPVASAASTFLSVRLGADKRAIRRLGGHRHAPLGYSFTRQTNNSRDVYEFGSGV
jgi:hypothetical protein